MAQKSQQYSDQAREFIDKEISRLVREKNMSQDQAVAAAHDTARRKGMKVPKNK